MSEFTVQVVSAETLLTLPGTWTPADFADLLEDADIGDLSGTPASDIEEMALLELQDRGPHDAAVLLLQRKLGGRLRKGQIEQLAHDMSEDKQWERYPDLSLHEPLFWVGSLLWRAMPRPFPKPDAQRIVLEVEARDAEARQMLADGVDEVLLVRLIADGLPPRALLHRLFADQLEQGAFDEAAAIVWTFASSPSPAGATIEIVGSEAWIGPLRDVDPWTSDARPTRAPAGTIPPKPTR